MTTIVYYKGMLAADRQVTCGNQIKMMKADIYSGGKIDTVTI